MWGRIRDGELCSVVGILAACGCERARHASCLISCPSSANRPAAFRCCCSRCRKDRLLTAAFDGRSLFTAGIRRRHLPDRRATMRAGRYPLETSYTHLTHTGLLEIGSIVNYRGQVARVFARSPAGARTCLHAGRVRPKNHFSHSFFPSALLLRLLVDRRAKPLPIRSTCRPI